MNEVFPPLHTVSTSTAAPGSIVRIPRSGGPLLAFVTDRPADKGGRSYVMLNAKIERRPPILFAENWQNVDSCLAFSGKLQFELSAELKDIDPNGNKWWEESGVIVCVGDQFYLRAAPFDGFMGNYQFANVQTGSLLTEQIPNSVWSFGVWSIWLRDTIAQRSFSIFDFSVHAKAK